MHDRRTPVDRLQKIFPVLRIATLLAISHVFMGHHSKTLAWTKILSTLANSRSCQPYSAKNTSKPSDSG